MMFHSLENFDNVFVHIIHGGCRTIEVRYSDYTVVGLCRSTNKLKSTISFGEITSRF